MATATAADMPKIKRSERTPGRAIVGLLTEASVCAATWLRFPVFPGVFRLRANVVPWGKSSPIRSETPAKIRRTPRRARQLPRDGAWNAAVPLQLLDGQTRQALHPCDRRRAPFTGERLGLWTIEPHGQVERGLRRGKPIGFLVLSRALVLKIDIERAIGVGLERH